MGGHGDHTQKLCLRPWLRKNKGKGPTEPRSAYKGGLDLHGPQAGLQGGFCASLVARDRVGSLLGQNAQHGQSLGSTGTPPHLEDKCPGDLGSKSCFTGCFIPGTWSKATVCLAVPELSAECTLSELLSPQNPRCLPPGASTLVLVSSTTSPLPHPSPEAPGPTGFNFKMASWSDKTLPSF